MKKKLLWVLQGVLLSGLILIGCKSSPATANCPSPWGECNAIVACGRTSCAGYWGGICNC